MISGETTSAGLSRTRRRVLARAASHSGYFYSGVFLQGIYGLLRARLTRTEISNWIPDPMDHDRVDES